MIVERRLSRETINHIRRIIAALLNGPRTPRINQMIQFLFDLEMLHTKHSECTEFRFDANAYRESFETLASGTTKCGTNFGEPVR